jgi:predicted DNA-binding ribbon-helix-helix protein
MEASRVTKRSAVVRGHKTSLSLEQPFWNEALAIAGRSKITISALVQSIDDRRQHHNLSSAVRCFVLEHVLKRLAEAEDEETLVENNGIATPAMCLTA